MVICYAFSENDIAGKSDTDKEGTGRNDVC